MKGHLHVRDDEEPDVTSINWDVLMPYLKYGNCHRCGNHTHVPADCPLNRGTP